MKNRRNLMTKSKIRTISLAKQRSLTRSERIEKSLGIKERFFEWFDLTNISFFHYFRSIEEKNEVETSFIIKELRQKPFSIRTVAPRVNFEEKILEHIEVNRDTRFETNHWGITEPAGNELMDEKEIDLVLVPLLCFDKRGFRVGYGGGYYDKFLSRCRKDCLKIGLSFFEPIEEIEDIKPHDIGLDYCVTPEKTWNF